MSFPNFITFYKPKHDYKYYTYNYETKAFKIYDNLKGFKLNHFELMEGYEATEADLVRYANDMVKWRNELLEASKGKLDYFDNKCQIKNHFRNVKRFLNLYMRNKDKYEEFQPITIEEHNWFKKCYNAGLLFHQDGVYENITTYDKKMFYPTILGCNKFFEIPNHAGHLRTFNKIPTNSFKYGIYHVKITSNDSNFNKVFMFSKHNHYTHYDLNFVKHYNFKYAKPDNLIQMELMSTKHLVYDKKEWLETGTMYFSKWYHKLKSYKTAYPKNKLIKRLTSSVWGTMMHKNVIVKTEEEIEREELDIGTSMNVEDNQYYIKRDMIDKLELIDLSNPMYEYKFRLMPFLQAFGRSVMAQIALKNIDNVIRIETDSITYDIDIEIDAFEFVKEADKSGCRAEIKGRSLLLK